MVSTQFEYCFSSLFTRKKIASSPICLFYRFDVDDVSGKLDSNRPVPFRMTPNITEFVTPVGVSGPLTASMISAARCFVQPSFKIASILRAVLRDEMIAWNKKNGGANANTTSATASNSPDVAPANNIDQENRDKEVNFSEKMY